MIGVMIGVERAGARQPTPVRSSRRRALWLVPIVALAAGCGGGGAADGGGADEAPLAVTATQEAPKNTLTAEEVAAGWQLLFDGESTAGWRGYNQEGFPEEGWAVMDGDLVVFASDGSEAGLGGDIVTDETFSDFELTFDFVVSPVGNSGVFYRVAEHEGLNMWMVAPEFQVLDDTAYIEMGTMDMHKHLTGDNYDLHASAVTATNPIGEWNHARIVVDGAHVEHWLNGQMTVEYELWSPEWTELVGASKFAPYPQYGAATEGRIGIQDHGHEIRYKNIKIRPLLGGR